MAIIRECEPWVLGIPFRKCRVPLGNEMEAQKPRLVANPPSLLVAKAFLCLTASAHHSATSLNTLLLIFWSLPLPHSLSATLVQGQHSPSSHNGI